MNGITDAPNCQAFGDIGRVIRSFDVRPKNWSEF
jgi:hypothetical protein